MSENANVYLTGNITLEIAGQQETLPVFVFKNQRRQKGSNQPHMRIYTKVGDKLSELGALWYKRKEE